MRPASQAEPDHERENVEDPPARTLFFDIANDGFGNAGIGDHASEDTFEEVSRVDVHIVGIIRPTGAIGSLPC